MFFFRKDSNISINLFHQNELDFWYTIEMPLNFSHSIGKKLQKNIIFEVLIYIS